MAGQNGVKKLAERHPWHLWALPVIVFTAGLLVYGVVEGLALTVTRTLIPWMPAGPVGCAMACLWTATLTTPQQHCVRLGSMTLLLLLSSLVVHLQFFTVLALLQWGRVWGMLLCGLPNAVVTGHILLCGMLHLMGIMSALSLRQNVWYVYVLEAPVVLLPQALTLLLWCPVSLGAQVCVEHLSLAPLASLSWP